MKRTGEDKPDAKPGGSGLAMLRPGFAWTPADDARFALGFPHVREVVDPPADESTPRPSARALVERVDRAPQLRWYRDTAQSVVRAWGGVAAWEQSLNERILRAQAVKDIARTDPLTREEADALLGNRLERELPGLSERAVENVVLLLEALVGAEAVVESIVSRLESFDAEMLLSEWSLPPVVTWQLGYLLLRLPEPLATAQRRRLRACLDCALDFRPWLRRRGFTGTGSSHARSLHCVLNGGAGAEDTDRTLRWYGHVVDDPVLVRMRVHLNRLSYAPDARLVFLGGIEVLEHFARDWRRLAGEDEQRWFVDQHARIRAPQIVGLLLVMACESAVKDHALQTLDDLRPHVEGDVAAALKHDKPGAAAAKRLVERWSKKG
ncbi:MAG: hypothetical protein ACOZNI_12725 [Myxococcota bacterium]